MKRSKSTEFFYIDRKTNRISDEKIHAEILDNVDPLAIRATEEDTRQRLIAQGWDIATIELLFSSSGKTSK